MFSVTDKAHLETAAEAIAQAVEQAEGKLPPKKRQLVKAAVLCFAEEGFAATSTRAIAQRAGVAEATIFRHFETKRELLLRLVRPVLSGLIMPAITQQKEIQLSDIHDLRVLLRTVMLDRLNFADTYAPLVRILIQEIMINEDLKDVVAEELAVPLVTLVRGSFAELIGAGGSGSATADQFFRMMASSLLGYYIQRSILMPGSHWDDHAEVDAMVRVLCDGVLGGAEKQRR